MRKRFIVLVDFSKDAGNLIKYAHQWSLESKAQLLLVHNTAINIPAFTRSDSKQELIKQFNQRALEELKELTQCSIPQAENVLYYVSDLNLNVVLSSLVSDNYQHLIFVGLKGTKFIKKLLLGNFALDIINNTNNNVVAMPIEMDTYTHEKIFIALNNKNPINIEELNNFLSFIDEKNTHITFFHLATAEEDTSEIKIILKELAKKYAQQYKTDYAIYEGSSRVEDIKKVINNNIDEILVVQRGSRLLADELFRRFLIKDLVYEGKTPLVILPNP